MNFNTAGSQVEYRAIVQVLKDLQQEQETGTYQEMTTRADLQPPSVMHGLSLVLEDLMREDFAADRPLRSAVAVSRSGTSLPQHGFFAAG